MTPYIPAHTCTAVAYRIQEEVILYPLYPRPIPQRPEVDPRIYSGLADDCWAVRGRVLPHIREHFGAEQVGRRRYAIAEVVRL